MEAFEHQHVPFEVLVERLNPARSLAHHPLIQVLLAWQNFAGHTDPAAGLVLEGLAGHVYARWTPTARAWIWRFLSVNAFPTDTGEPAGIGGAVEFRTDVFDTVSIQTLIERLERVLVAMTADPGRSLSSVDLLDDGWSMPAG